MDLDIAAGDASSARIISRVEFLYIDDLTDLRPLMVYQLPNVAMKFTPLKNYPLVMVIGALNGVKPGFRYLHFCDAKKWRKVSLLQTNAFIIEGYENEERCNGFGVTVLTRVCVDGGSCTVYGSNCGCRRRGIFKGQC